MSIEKELKVALVTNMLPPYRVGFYSALAKKVKLHVIVNVQSEFDRSWKVDTDDLPFEISILNSKSIVYSRKRKDVDYTEKREFHLNGKLYPELRKVRPDVIVAMEFGIRTGIASIYSKLNNVPMIVGWEGTDHTEKEASFLKKTVRKYLAGCASRFWSNGLESEQNLLGYGVRKETVDNGMTGVSTRDLYAVTQELFPQRDQFRSELGLKGCTLLFNGSLSPRKGTKQYLDALTKFVAENKELEFSLIFLGSGKYADDVSAWAKAHPQIPVVETGFIQPVEIPRFFVAADWAVLPTLDDNWPLATLEVLVAGLPQLFSQYNGASKDLCEPETTGYLFDPLDESDFVEKLGRVLQKGPQRIEDSKVREYMEFYGNEGQAQRAEASIQKVINNSK